MNKVRDKKSLYAVNCDLEMEGADVNGCWQCVTNVISGWSYSSSEGPAITAPSLVNTHDCNVLKYNAGIHKWLIGEEEQ